MAREGRKLFHCLTYVQPTIKSGSTITDSLYYRKFFEMEKEKMEENQNKSDLYVRTAKLKKYKNEFHVHEDIKV